MESKLEERRLDFKRWDEKLSQLSFKMRDVLIYWAVCSIFSIVILYKFIFYCCCWWWWWCCCPPPRPSSSASSYQIEVKLGVGKNEGRAENVKGEHFSLDECEKSGSVGVAGVGRRRQLLDKNGLTPPSSPRRNYHKNTRKLIKRNISHFPPFISQYDNIDSISNLWFMTFFFYLGRCVFPFLRVCVCVCVCLFLSAPLPMDWSLVVTSVLSLC